MLERLVEAPGPLPKASAPRVELLDAEPPTLRRPLALIGGRAYAAAWLHVRVTKDDEVTKAGELVRLDPPRVTVESPRRNSQPTLAPPSPRGRSLTEQKVVPPVPAGLPSSLMDRRPDVLLAEQTLVAENARIGQAKALLFPQITLSGALGTQSSALSDLFTNPATYWSGVAGLVVTTGAAGARDDVLYDLFYLFFPVGNGTVLPLRYVNVIEAEE